MKKSFFLFPVMMLLWSSIWGQEFLPEEYLEVRNQNIGLTTPALESRYPRPAPSYLRYFENGVDFKTILYLDSVILKLELTPDEAELLKQNLFMVTERLSFSNFGQALHTVYNQDLPVFVTTDAILHALHMSYDKILKTLEREVMSANLEKFLSSLYDNFGILVQKYGAFPEVNDGLADADLYVTISLSLIRDILMKGHVADQEAISAVWKAVRSEKMTEMPLFSYPDRSRKLDFSQFTVRGHYVYTEQEKWMGLKSLEPYFRTMMWLGRIDFLLTPPPENPWEQPWSDREIQRMHIGAFLVNELVASSAANGLFAINETIIDYLVGTSDNITPPEYGDILSSQGITSAVQLTDTTVFKALKRSLGSDPGLGQKILSDFFLMDPWAEEPGVLPVSYRLSGQRFIIDSYILGSMVFDKVVFNGEKVMRMMPKPLDAIFALGNNDALPLLRNELEKYPYAGQLANMRYLTDAKPLSFWEESLYNVWLNALRDLNPGPDEQAKPLFMQTAAWHQEKMNTQLASWSHLRHDNLLYAKQSYTGGTGCSFPWSYVEPYPAFYGRLKSYATDAAAFFSSLPISSPEINRVVDFFPRFGEVMEKLETLAVKELDKVPFSQEENQWLQTMLFHKSGSGIPPYTGWYADLFFDTWDTSEGDFTIVDIHTQPTDESGNVVGRVLHTGVGQVNLGVFLSNHPLCPDRMMAFAGPVLSYYEKTTSGFQRMTDQEWETMVWQGKMPERPDWTNMYLAGITGAMRAKGAELPYQFYTGTSAKPLSKPEILVYPNPVGDQLFISFRTHVNTRATISLYNGSGTLVKVLPAQQFLSGENSLTIPFHDMPEGIYLLRIMTENGPCTVSKVIKN